MQDDGELVVELLRGPSGKLKGLARLDLVTRLVDRLPIDLHRAIGNQGFGLPP
ncbi:hypothetical protein GCM10011503_27600 [Henriciella pelagia]|uniref:Uncharacterized protein n=1 Tax=Henriciella pelagia TaxID=1977912 RepID=A0ABQ1JWI5_9PROT|nr:hypothetical protein GCM10011503_27600 [Henriciella pelagia]